VADEPPRARIDLPSWWWDLPLRWKGFITVLLPTVALVLSIIGAVVLNVQRDHLRQNVVADREVQDLSRAVQQQLSDVERAVLRYAATGDDAFVTGLSDLRANFTRDAPALLEQADGEVHPLAEDAVQSARTAFDQLDELRGLVAGGPVDRLTATVRAAQDRSRTTAARFGAVDARLAADVASGGERIDDRGVQIVVVLIGGVLLAAIAVWITNWLFTRSIVQRIRTIGDVAGGVIAGDKVIDIEEPANDEIGKLAQQLRLAAEVLILNNLELERTRDAEGERLEREQVIRDVVRRIHEAVGQDEVLAATSASSVRPPTPIGFSSYRSSTAAWGRCSPSGSPTASRGSVLGGTCRRTSSATSTSASSAASAMPSPSTTSPRPASSPRPGSCSVSSVSVRCCSRQCSLTTNPLPPWCC
jgi:HAMP domain-containing protein